MMVTLVQGLFSKVRGAILVDPQEPAATSAEIKIDAASTYTGVDRRDKHLRSAESRFVVGEGGRPAAYRCAKSWTAFRSGSRGWSKEIVGKER